MEENVSLRNRRISPKGMIDLPFVVRKHLGFRKGEKKFLRVTVRSGKVQISPTTEIGPDTCRASPRGLMKLPEAAHDALSLGGKCRYSVEIADNEDLFLDNRSEASIPIVTLASAEM